MKFRVWWLHGVVFLEPGTENTRWILIYWKVFIIYANMCMESRETGCRLVRKGEKGKEEVWWIWVLECPFVVVRARQWREWVDEAKWQKRELIMEVRWCIERCRWEIIGVGSHQSLVSPTALTLSPHILVLSVLRAPPSLPSLDTCLPACLPPCLPAFPLFFLPPLVPPSVLHNFVLLMATKTLSTIPCLVLVLLSLLEPH